MICEFIDLLFFRCKTVEHAQCIKLANFFLRGRLDVGLQVKTYYNQEWILMPLFKFSGFTSILPLYSLELMNLDTVKCMCMGAKLNEYGTEIKYGTPSDFAIWQ